MFKRIKQWFVDAELVAVSRDLERVADSITTAASRLELLEGRFTRLQNRLQMRMARAELSGDQDAQILADIRRRGSNGGGAPGDEPWPRDW